MPRKIGRLAGNATSALFWPSSPLPPDDVMLIVFNFAGGPWDGVSIRSDRGGQHILDEAGFWWELTNGGQIGTEFRGVLDGFYEDFEKRGLEAARGDGTDKNLYVLEEKQEEPGRLTFLFRFRGTDAS